MNVMNWEECENKFIRKVEVDKERINSIKEKVEQRLDIVNKIETKDETISFIIEGYYEAIKELLVAYLMLNGLRSKNHQCLISYFQKNNPELEHYTMIISKMSYYRNRLNYYGESVPKTFFEENKDVIKEIIKKLDSITK